MDKTLKERIREGEVIHSIGVPMDFGRGQLEDVMAQGDYDFISVDCQHRAFSEERLVQFCLMAQDMNIHVRGRIKHTRHAYLVGTYLDLGLSSIMVPEVQDEATAKEAVNAFYYPQFGKRSWGGEAREGLEDRPDRLEYAAWWNQYGTLSIQIESVDAVVNARQLALPGIDFFAFGPNDLMFSLEAHPLFPFRTYDECVRHVVDQVQDTHVKVGLAAETVEEEEKFREMGVTVFGGTNLGSR